MISQLTFLVCVICALQLPEEGTANVLFGYKERALTSITHETYNCRDKNPCTEANIQAGLFFFSHQNRHQYIQCTDHSECIERFCAPAMIWKQTVLNCIRGNPSKTTLESTTTVKTSTLKPTTMEATTAEATTTEATTAIQTTMSMSEKTERYNCKSDNPCSSGDSRQEITYFRHEEESMYVQCSEGGECFEKLCPSDTIWESLVLLCVLTNTTQPLSTSVESELMIYDCQNNSPCGQEHRDAGRFYFCHKDPCKFIQCSEFGQCHVMPCSDGSFWNGELQTCTSTPRKD